MNLNLKGKVALALASSQGLGKAIAAELVTEGASVMLASRDADKLASVQSELTGLGKGKVLFQQTDITKSAELEQLMKATIEQFGKIDILVNNAGGPPSGMFEEITDEQWQDTFELNLLSYIRSIRAALPELKKSNGRIINIASASIKQPIPGLILSNTFRTGIVGLTKTLAEELAPYGVLIHTVAPGRIATDRVAQLDQLQADRLGVSREEVEQLVQKQIPLGRYGTPQEFAKVVAFLVSDACTYMTGNAFLIDGGMIKSI
ncbi:3-oxoacyl-ACP reductase [Ammoniphilus oxalaticus]|uniref:3-oxoacyl-ACP reductase n=1 Tax=Ammoniphilus oxalaticus TaxID=66863 RepID=A0A419SEE1_9BACL|nr:SDR family oxidoreductase [Ammoniphilus oxalaticus]RKD21699.1 3-oxoacyl-ACP reductase [Ammoniphilus oxalaticus]